MNCDNSVAEELRNSETIMRPGTGQILPSTDGGVKRPLFREIENDACAQAMPVLPVREYHLG